MDKVKQKKGGGLAAWHAARLLPLALCLLAAAQAFAEVVHVIEQTEKAGVLGAISDQTLDTGTTYTTANPPTLSGCIFTHWTFDASQSLTSRDPWGRSLDNASFTVYENTTLTAHYLPTSQDTDSDGVADGYELYWYGSLAETAESDTDGDGFSFAEEIANGTNPLFADSHRDGPVVVVDTGVLQYNPHGYLPYTVMSDPEGALLATEVEFVRAGTQVTRSSSASTFAYWTVDGVVQRDAWGRALDTVSFAMPTNAVVLVAKAVTDDTERAQLYWYGTTGVAMDSDTDGDGYTFAEEIANGTNPLFPNSHKEGPVVVVDTGVWQYNPYNLHPYTVMSDPENALFPTTNEYVRAGTTVVSSGTFVPSSSSSFAYWTIGGVVQRDAWGRALDTVSFTMPTNAVALVAKAVTNETERAKLYWYGTTDLEMDSDTDGDGMTFAEEIATGTNPLFAEYNLKGPIIYADTSAHELNLQVYEQMQGAIIDGNYTEIFTSPVAGNEETSETFGANLRPIVWDVNGDGLFDIILVYDEGATILLNVGRDGCPEFEMSDDMTLTNGVDFAMNDVSRLDDAALDTPLVDGLSATFGDADQDGVEDVLCSDAAGRIWFYRGSRLEQTGESSSYTLQHKVWGGSYAGFAEGLRLAAVDWENDGDLDCLAGTADGKLMLLRDPKVGRPTNLKAVGGVDSILLTWDPNAQSRIRGYRLYRRESVEETQDEGFERIAQPTLPTYRDYPEEVSAYAYKVTSVSRFYTAGNSTPTETESIATEVAEAKLGTVVLSLGDAAAFGGTNVEVSLSIENSLGVGASGGEITVNYDTLLSPVDVKPSGLSENADFSWMKDDEAGTLTISITGGTIDAGSGTFFTLVFATGDVEEETTAAVTIESASLKSDTGADIVVVLPDEGAGGNIAITPFDEPDEDDADDVGVDLPAPSDIPDEGDDNNIDDEDVDNNDDVEKDESEIEIRGYGGQAGLVVGIAKATVGETQTVALPVGMRSLNFSHWWGGSGNLNVLVSRSTINFTYDPVLLEPVSVEGLLGTAWSWRAQHGVLTVQGTRTSGNLALGCLPTSKTQYPIRITFKVLEQYSKHEAVVGFGDVAIATTSYRKVYTPIRRYGGVAIRYTRPAGDSTIVSPYSLGDVNGDGRLTKADLDKMSQLVGFFGLFASRNQIRAGDYNGNGWLDYADYQLMRQHFTKLGVVSKGERGQEGRYW